MRALVGKTSAMARAGVVMALLLVAVLSGAQLANAADSWSTPVDLSTIGEDAAIPQVAMSGSTVIITWYQYSGPHAIVQYARSTDGGATWSDPVSLSDTSYDSYNPQVAMSGSTAIITWYQNNGSHDIVQSKTSSTGGATWILPTVDLSDTSHDAYSPQVAMSGSTAIITWHQYDGSHEIVQSRTSSDGGVGWDREVDLSNSTQDAFDPQIAMSGSTAIITWKWFDGSNYIVQSKTSSDGGATWILPTVDLSVSRQDAFDPQVAMSGSTAIITWFQYNGFYDVVQSKTSTDGGATWILPTVDLSVSGQDAHAPQIAMSGSTAIITWFQYDGSNYIVQSKTSSDGGATWILPTVDLSVSGQDAFYPQVAMSGSTAIITWYQYGGPNNIVASVRSSDGGATWSSPVDVSASGRDPLFPQVAMSDSAAIITWNRYNGSNNIVQSSYATATTNTADASVPRSELRFVLPNGRECSSISPQIVVNFTQFQLPGDQANCRTPGAVITGWRIPGQSWAFGPSGIVNVIDSQTFTAVLREPVVRIVLDANVAAEDACTVSGATSASSVPVDQRAVTLFLQRKDMTTPGRPDQPALVSYLMPSAPPCSPLGYRFTSWNTAGKGTGTQVSAAAALPTSLTDTANTVRLFAQWARVTQ